MSANSLGLAPASRFIAQSAATSSIMSSATSRAGRPLNFSRFSGDSAGNSTSGLNSSSMRESANSACVGSALGLENDRTNAFSATSRACVAFPETALTAIRANPAPGCR